MVHKNRRPFGASEDGLREELAGFFGSESHGVVFVFPIPARADEEVRKERVERGHNINMEGPKERYLCPSSIFSEKQLYLFLTEGISHDGDSVQVTSGD